jgi:hypothetical protein
MATSAENVYTGVVNYVRRMVALRPSKADDVRMQQHSHLLMLLRHCSTFGHSDATAILDHLDDAEAPWTPAQRASIEDVISTLVGESSSLATPTASQKQVHRHLQNYLPAFLWAIVASNESIRNTCVHMAKFFIDVLGLRNADESTRRDALSLVLAARKLDLDGPVAYGHVREFGVTLDSLKAATPGTAKLATYPPSVEEFVRMFPAAYSPGHPPVESQVDYRELQLKIGTTPARSSHRLMHNDEGVHARKRKGKSMSSDTPTSDLMNMMKGFMLGTQNEIPAEMRAHRRRSDATPPVGPLAIADGRVDRDAPLLDEKSGADPLCGNVEALRASARSKLESAFAKHGASFAAAVDGEGDDDDDDDAEEGEEETEDEETPAKKRPAASHKKPAASHKKPAAAPAMRRPSGAPTPSGVGGKKWKVLKFYRRNGLKKGEAYFLYEAPWGEKFTSKTKARVHASFHL